MLVNSCQLIIEGMLITTVAGDYRLVSFVDEQRMCRLYEKYYSYTTQVQFDKHTLHSNNLYQIFYLCKKSKLSIWRGGEYRFRYASLCEDRRNSARQCVPDAW